MKDDYVPIKKGQLWSLSSPGGEYIVLILGPAGYATFSIQTLSSPPGVKTENKIALYMHQDHWKLIADVK